jgi:hypothetical protein
LSGKRLTESQLRAALETDKSDPSGIQLTPMKVQHALERIEIRAWQDLFSANWGNFPIQKKCLLESAVTCEINSAAAFRHPQNGKDVVMLTAVTLNGGIGLDMDVTVKGQINLSSPFGFLFTAYERPSNELKLSFECAPAIIAAMKDSVAAYKALEETADFLARIDRYEEKRRPSRPFSILSPRPQGDNVREQLSRQLAEQPAHAMTDLLGAGCYTRFAGSLNQLERLFQNKIFEVPYAAHSGMKVTRRGMRAGSEPPQKRPLITARASELAERPASSSSRQGSEVDANTLAGNQLQGLRDASSSKHGQSPGNNYWIQR